jgi:uncharacterized protein YkwD
MRSPSPVSKRPQPACLFVVLILLATAGRGAVKRYVPPTPEQIERELLELINRDRAALGRPPLLAHPALQEIARDHSARMAAANELSHYFPGWPRPEQRLQRAGLCFLASSENVARGPSPIARFIHEALMDSVTHRINILDGRMLQAGIGVIKEGEEFYVTQEFAAIIDCPLPEVVMVRIENELVRWHRERYVAPPVIESAARLPARVSAQQYLLGNPLSVGVASERGMHGVTVCYNDLAAILSELKKEIDRGPFAALAVGVAWGRNASFPGGAYAVCLLLFP